MTNLDTSHATQKNSYNAIVNDDFTIELDDQGFNLWLVDQGLTDREKMLKVSIELLKQKYLDSIEQAFIEREFHPNQFGIVFFLFRVCLESGAEYMQGSRNLLRGC